MKPFTLPPAQDAKDFSSIDPLDGRYYDPRISQYLSESARIAAQAYLEAALAQTLAQHSVCSQAVADEIEVAATKLTAQQVAEEEKATKHDVKALVNVIKANVSDEAKPFVHFGATSYDIIESANALQMKTAINDLVLPQLKSLLQTLIALVDKYADTTQIGRTHGQHAVPITFGFAISEYVSRIGASTMAVQDLAGMLHGKFSGAVGAYNALSLFIDDPMKFETEVLDKVGLKPAEYSNQIVPSEEMIRLMDEFAILAGIMANLGNDMRNLQRSEIDEVREHFEEGQTGSSTMAHKKNPASLENVVSLAKQVLAQSINANLNISSDHQRDLTDSAASRFYILSPALIVTMASRLTQVMANLEVNEQAMQKNLLISGGAIASEPLYLLFEKYGHVAAHEKAKDLAHQAIQQKKQLVEVIVADSEASEYWKKFAPQEQQIVSEPQKYYIGLASQKAKSVVDIWRKSL